MKAVTYNLRVEAGGDGVNQFCLRRGFVVGTIAEKRPDILGFQECAVHMKDFLIRCLPEYSIVGHGREADYGGESTCIAFLKEKFELMALDTFWLSPTPRTPGSRFEGQSTCPRVATMVKLRSIANGKLFRVYNTHLDHISDEARRLGAAQLMNRIKADTAEEPMPLLVMGDFNNTPDAPALREFLDDPTLPLEDYEADLAVSFHDYGRPPEECSRIDYILGRGFLANGYSLWEETDSGMWLSDHFPIEVQLKLL